MRVVSDLNISTDEQQASPRTSDGSLPRPFSFRAPTAHKAPRTSWNPRATTEFPELQGWQLERLAPWPEDLDTKYVSYGAAVHLLNIDWRELVNVKKNRTATQCYKFGSIGRTGKSIAGGMHPCASATCKQCAITTTARLLRHVYVGVQDRETVWVCDVPIAIWRRGAIQKQIGRSVDFESGGQGQYTAFQRDDDRRAYVYSTVEITGAFARYATPMDSASAVEHARDVALRLPFINDGSNRRWTTSKGWSLPKPVRRDVTYMEGITDRWIIERFETGIAWGMLEYYKAGRFQTDLSDSELDALAARVERSLWLS